jgi:hypothetical protein
MKKCNKCEVEKELDEFYNSSNTQDGKDYQCKSCRRIYKNRPDQRKKASESKRNKRLNNPEHAEKLRARMRSYSRERPEWYLYTKAKGRAKLKGLEFNISLDDIVIPKYCPILGIELTKGKTGDYQNSASVDRIDSSKGYVKGNVAIISVIANTMKSFASREMLENFSKNILQYYDSNIVI